MTIKFKSKHGKYALLDCFGHVPARVYLTNDSWVDLGRFSYSSIKTFLMFSNGRFNGLLAKIGDFFECARDVKILLGGEHDHSKTHNYVLFGSPPTQKLAKLEGYDTRHDRKGPIMIGHGVVAHYRTTILSGVNIGDGCALAAGSVIVNDCQSGGIYGGVPAKLLSQRKINFEELNALSQVNAIGVARLLGGKKVQENEYKSRPECDRLLLMVKYRDSSGEGGDFDFRILGATVGGINYPLKEGTPFHKYAAQAATGNESSEFDWEVDPLGLRMI